MEKSEGEIKNVYKLLFESAAEGLIVVNNHGIISIANRRANEMFGYVGNALVGLTVEALLPEKYHHTHVAQRNNFAKAPSSRSMGAGLDLAGKRQDGSLFPVEISLNHFKDQGGEMYVMALITDITVRRQAEDQIRKSNEELENGVKQRTKELEESQKLYKIVARNFPDGTINVFDGELNYVFVEGMELFKYGVTSENLVGTSYLDRLPNEVREFMKEKLMEVFKGKGNSSFEVKLENRNYSMNAVALHNSNGDIDQVLLVERDSTKEKKAEKDMLEALEKERQLNELKSRFVSMASHEFRTPLGAILSSTSLIEEYLSHKEATINYVREKTDKHLKRIKSSIGNLTSILNDFLSLDKLEQGKVDPIPDFIDITKLINDLIEELKPTLKKGQTIQYKHEGDKSQVFADEQMLRNVLLNLLSNAKKYSSEDSIIEVNTAYANGFLIATVTDHGMGIPVDDQEHLFERFFRAKNAIHLQGTGLGLNIVKRYLDLMGGNISFKTQEGKGTSFIITLQTQ